MYCTVRSKIFLIIYKLAENITMTNWIALFEKSQAWTNKEGKSFNSGYIVLPTPQPTSNSVFPTSTVFKNIQRGYYDYMCKDTNFIFKCW